MHVYNNSVHLPSINQHCLTAYRGSRIMVACCGIEPFRVVIKHTTELLVYTYLECYDFISFVLQTPLYGNGHIAVLLKAADVNRVSH